jgi:Transposase and inactivated derivatives
VAKLCQVLDVSRSGYYAWKNRPTSARDIENVNLTERIKTIHQQKNRTCGCRKITKEICRSGKIVNHKRVERIMKQEGIRSKLAKKFKATTNSKHDLPVAENILNREFTVKKPNPKMVSDITYLWTDEGWLYIAGVLDLCGQKMVGLSIGERMTKKLVISALKNAYRRSAVPAE